MSSYLNALDFAAIVMLATGLGGAIYVACLLASRAWYTAKYSAIRRALKSSKPQSQHEASEEEV